MSFDAVFFSMYALHELNCGLPLHKHLRVKANRCHREVWLPFWALCQREISGLVASCLLHLINNVSSQSKERSWNLVNTLPFQQQVCVTSYCTSLTFPLVRLVYSGQG